MKKQLIATLALLALGGCATDNLHWPWQEANAPVSEKRLIVLDGSGAAAPPADPARPALVVDGAAYASVTPPAAPEAPQPLALPPVFASAQDAPMVAPLPIASPATPVPARKEAPAPKMAQCPVMGAAPRPNMPSPFCRPVNQSVVSIRFNYVSPDIANLDGKLRAQAEALRARALKLGAESAEIWGFNYNVKNVAGGVAGSDSYAVSGNASLRITPPEKGAALVSWLNGAPEYKDYRVDLNVHVSDCPMQMR